MLSLPHSIRSCIHAAGMPEPVSTRVASHLLQIPSPPLSMRPSLACARAWKLHAVPIQDHLMSTRRSDLDTDVLICPTEVLTGLTTDGAYGRDVSQPEETPE